MEKQDTKVYEILNFVGMEIYGSDSMLAVHIPDFK